MKLLSTEAEGVTEHIAEDNKSQFVNEAGRVGALLGLKSLERSSMTAGSSASTSMAISELSCQSLTAFCCGLAIGLGAYMSNSMCSSAIALLQSGSVAW